MCVNITELREAIREKGWTITRLAFAAQMDRKVLQNRLAGGGKDFKMREVHAIIQALQLSEGERNLIFFARPAAC